MNETVYLVATLLAAAVLILVLYLRHQQEQQLQKSYALCDLKLKKLSPTSPTRLRLQEAKETFEKGWKALKSKEPYGCLEYFAKAVEIDELGCAWKQKFESKLEEIGDFFTLPPKDDRDKYQSMLSEAYLVILLYTVVSLYGKQEGDLEEDFRVVKTRLDVCVRLQPENPMIYKLRADFLQRFGHLANRIELINDFTKAIELAERDEDGKKLNCGKLDPKQQRKFVLAYCHHQLASLLHRNKDMEGAYKHYAAAVEHADPDFINLAECQFSLCILTLMRTKKVDAADKPGVLLKAMQHYKAGLIAEKQALKYLPYVNVDVSKKLAKELSKKFARANAAPFVPNKL